MRCSAARSLLTSDSRIFTLSVRTLDLVDNSYNCESFRASCSLHIDRARCDNSRSRLPGVRAGPDFPFWFLVLVLWTEGAGTAGAGTAGAWTAGTGGKDTGMDTIAGGGVVGICCWCGRRWYICCCRSCCW